MVYTEHQVVNLHKKNYFKKYLFIYFQVLFKSVKEISQRDVLKLYLLPPHSGSSERLALTHFWCDLVGSAHLRPFPAMFYWYSIFLSVCCHGNGWTFQSLSVVPYTNSPARLICSPCSVLWGYGLTKSFPQCIKCSGHKSLSVLFQ